MVLKTLATYFTLFIAILPGLAEDRISYQYDIIPILSGKCFLCHGQSKESRKAGLRLDHPAQATARLKSGHTAIVPGNLKASELIARITHPDPEERMPPPDAKKDLTPQEIEQLKKWIESGAQYEEHWSFQPLERPTVPNLDNEWIRNPVDAFILAKLKTKGFNPSAKAKRRTLVRRLYFDLIGLPPSPNEIEAFVNDQDPKAYENLVDRLLASPHYGERFGRHWLDVVKYADTHGYDKDKPRPNAWPYRDYVIRSFNEDKPYTRFVQEQIAGDVLYPDSPDGITALGFIAAGPWDLIGHAEVPETKIDGKVARNLDRDDMVSNTINTFNSITVQCARCHDHKFDPITQEHYYSMQSIFAAVDRADRAYDQPEVAKKRKVLEREKKDLEAKQKALETRVQKTAGESYTALKKKVETLKKQTGKVVKNPAFGWHSQIVKDQNIEKWVQVDLGKKTDGAKIVLRPCHDEYNGIGAGFGFPVRFKVEGSTDPDFKTEVKRLADETSQDYDNPGLVPYTIEKPFRQIRYIRVTATKLAPRHNDFIFALAELEAGDETGKNLARGAAVKSIDSIQAPVRWTRKNLTDGYFAQGGNPLAAEEFAAATDQLKEMESRIWTPQWVAEKEDLRKNLNRVEEQIKALPKSKMVYAAATNFKPMGQFKATGGKLRTVKILHRGNITEPRADVKPGTFPLANDRPWQFELPPGHNESQRRKALAHWLTKPDHPLTWRSIVNRVWLWHFGQALVNSPNDFGRMGQPPTHPDLLDWLAVEFRDGGQRFKPLHKIILMSSTYQQSSTHHPAYAKKDQGNRYYWKMNRRRLDAESIRDAILKVSGKLDLKMYGPGYRLFVLEKPQHSPHYEYHKFEPQAPATHRRSVYRFVVRSQPDPFMTTLDCADSSRSTPKRDETITPLQALSLMNSKFTAYFASAFAERLKAAHTDPKDQVAYGFQLAMGRNADEGPLKELLAYAQTFGLDNACRILINLNEFVYVE